MRSLLLRGNRISALDGIELRQAPLLFQAHCTIKVMGIDWLMAPMLAVMVRT